MESRTKKLLEKYWIGESSLSEEQELKNYFAENPSLTTEGKYFRSLKQAQSPKQVTFVHPKKKHSKMRWSMAAVITAGLLTAVVVLQDARQQRQFVVEDPKEAYEITRKALLMVSSGLNEGKNYSKEISNINRAEEIIIEN
ncbi:MAG: hypothetical protein ACI83W_001201 [Marinoscillum sp.]|jgi:hypothetical protein